MAKEIAVSADELTGKDNKPKESKKPVSRKDMSRLQWTWKEIKRNKTAYFLVAPFMLIFFVFTVVPVFVSIGLSLTTFNMLQVPDFIFLDNYITLFLDDDLFIKALQNTLIFAAITGPVSYILSFVVAWFINELPPKFRALVTLVFYAPSISGAVYTIWAVILSGDSYGWVNGFLLNSGIILEPIQFFKNVNYCMPCCIIVALWTSLGTAFLSFIAGLQVVDRSLYEAGAVDGVKNRWQELWYITLPVMKSQLMFGAIMAITTSFGFGAVVDALAGNPSVDYCAWTLTHHLAEYGNVRFEVGYSSAIAVVLFALMFGSNLLVNKLLSKLGQ